MRSLLSLFDIQRIESNRFVYEDRITTDHWSYRWITKSHLAQFEDDPLRYIYDILTEDVQVTTVDEIYQELQEFIPKFYTHNLNKKDYTIIANKAVLSALQDFEEYYNLVESDLSEQDLIFLAYKTDDFMNSIQLGCNADNRINSLLIKPDYKKFYTVAKVI